MTFFRKAFAHETLLTFRCSHLVPPDDSVVAHLAKVDPSDHEVAVDDPGHQPEVSLEDVGHGAGQAGHL